MIKDPDAGAVLLDGCRPLACLLKDPHEKAMGRLVQGVERQQPPDVIARILKAARGRQGRAGSLQGLDSQPAEILGLRYLPVVKLGRVAKREASEEVGSIKSGRLAERRQTFPALLLESVAVLTDPPYGSPETHDVHIDSLGADGDRLAVGYQRRR